MARPLPTVLAPHARRAVDRLATAVADRVAQRLDPMVRLELRDLLHRDIQVELEPLLRILGQQGDAADQVAEVLGRTLARLSAEVEDLAAVVSALHAPPPTGPGDPEGH